MCQTLNVSPLMVTKTLGAWAHVRGHALSSPPSQPRHTGVSFVYVWRGAPKDYSRAPPLPPLRYVVLDEADKMLGLGFAQQLERLRALLLLPPSSSTLLPGGGGEGNGGGKKRKKKKKDELGAVPEVEGRGASASGPQVCCCVGWLVGRLVGCGVGWVVGLVGWLRCRLGSWVGWLAVVWGWVLGWLVGWLAVVWAG